MPYKSIKLNLKGKDITEAFGISDARNNELDFHLNFLFISQPDLMDEMDRLQAVLQFARNKNEELYLTYYIGKTINLNTAFSNTKE